MFRIAKSGAVAFAASLKSLTRQIETAVDALNGSVKRIDAAAPAEPVEDKHAAGAREPSDELLRGLAENLAELARGQARIADTVEGQGRARSAIGVAPSYGEGFAALLSAMIGAAEKNASVAAALLERVSADEAASGDGAEDAALRIEDLAQSNRAAAEQMLDVAIAWNRSHADLTAAPDPARAPAEGDARDDDSDVDAGKDADGDAPDL